MSQTITAADIAIQLENADITAAELTLDVLENQMPTGPGTIGPTEQLLVEVRAIMFPDQSVTRRLCDYQTGVDIREATADETQASIDAAELDGGVGVIEVDGRSCYAGWPYVS